MARRKDPLYAKIAHQLRSEIERSASKHLPPLRKLCEQYGVSLKTAAKAVHLLEDQGVVSIRQGSAVTIRGHAEADDEHESTGWGWNSSRSKLCAKIRQSIESGTFRSGQYLPKIKYYVVTEKVTDSTVTAAFDTLQKQGLVHRVGRRWVVGPSAGGSSGAHKDPATGVSSPVILIVVPDYYRWRMFFVEELRGFVGEFLACLRHYDTQFQVVQAEETGSFLPRHHPVGRDRILKTVDQLGKRYQGAFIHSHYSYFPDMQDWIEWLVQFGKPVMWFDYDNSAPTLDRRAVGSQRYFRLYSHIDAAVEVVLRVLEEYGHTRIGIARYGPNLNAAWTVQRVESIQRIARERYPSLSIDVECVPERFWEDYRDLVEPRTFDDTVLLYANAIEGELRGRHPKMSANKRRREVRERLLSSTPTLSNLVAHGCTVIVTMNQYMGVNALYWLDFVGLEVPADISLLAFDNIAPLVNHPISTVDFGFANLGYQAAHLFIGDIPVRTDRWGNIGSSPQFVNRGSLGAPRKRATRIRR